MKQNEILAFLNEHPACQLATEEGGQPRVRGMQMHRADGRGLVFQTVAGKPLVEQILKNPRVEACFNDFAKGVQIRVAGRAEIVEDRKLKEEIIAARGFLKPLIEEKGEGAVVIFRVTGCRAVVWTSADNAASGTAIAL